MRTHSEETRIDHRPAVPRIDSHGLTDIGQARGTNEDQFLVMSLGVNGLVEQSSLQVNQYSAVIGDLLEQVFVVADGVGGQKGGRRASRLAIQSLIDLFRHAPVIGATANDVAGQLESAFQGARLAMRGEARALPEYRKMATTLTVAHLAWPRLIVAHAGDSRCYLCRGDTIEQITEDQTLAQEMVNRGMIHQSQAENHQFSNVLSNCISPKMDRVDVVKYERQLEIGDTLILCTDGLTKYVTADEISSIVREEMIARDTCERLVQIANERGGSDNITVVVARIEPPL